MQKLKSSDHVFHSEVGITTRGKEAKSAEAVLDDSDDGSGSFCEGGAIESRTSC